LHVAGIAQTGDISPLQLQPILRSPKHHPLRKKIQRMKMVVLNTGEAKSLPVINVEENIFECQQSAFLNLQCWRRVKVNCVKSQSRTNEVQASLWPPFNCQGSGL
jgi:hypothetical protein